MVNVRAVVTSVLASLVLAAGCDAREQGTPDATASPDADPLFPYPPPRADVVPAIGGPDTLEIAAWNLENFPADAGMTPSLVADLVTSLDLDVVVVEEIASVAAWDELIARLREHDGVLSQHQYSPDSYQKIGVIHRAPMVTAGAAQLLFAGETWEFPRPPLAVPITVDGATLELVGVHLKAGVGADDAERRRLAIASLDAHLRAQVDGGGEAEVVVLGDYNQEVVEAADRAVLAPLLDAPDRYTVRTEPAAVAGGVSYLDFGGRFIDHLTTTAALDARWAAAQAVVPRLDQMLGGYEAGVSDHLPVILVVPR